MLALKLDLGRYCSYDFRDSMSKLDRAVALLIFAAIIAVSMWSVFTLTASATIDNLDPNWTNSEVMSVKRIGPTTNSLNHPVLFPNIDCVQIDYRIVSTSVMQTGCVYATSYGLVDPDTNMVIFNATDEAVPLLSLSGSEIFAPWPGQTDALVFSKVIGEGSAMAMYRNLVANTGDQRNILGQLTAKKLTTLPDIRFYNDDGTQMIVNQSGVAFSDRGGWTVVETVNGAFTRINLASFEKLPFAPAFGTASSSALLSSSVAISSNGRFVVISNAASVSFRVYDLSTCLAGFSPKYLNCKNFDYRPYISSQISGLTALRHVRFVNDDLISFTATTPFGDINYLLSPQRDIVALIDYLALGDSYTSGEGAFDYISGTDTTNNHCHLSIRSYPYLISSKVFSASGGHSVACSGARIRDILPTKPNEYNGQAVDSVPRKAIDSAKLADILSNFYPGYLAQSEFVSKYQPGVLTVSIGGNDIGFGNILMNCVLPRISIHLSDNVCYNTYEDRLELKNLIDKTMPTLMNLIRKLQTKSPSSRIYLIGYPQIVYDKGNCALNVRLSKSEFEFTADITAYINEVMSRAAVSAGVSYVDISDALNGYRLCEGPSYSLGVNGLTAGKDGGLLGIELFGKESYHPNAFGHSLIADYILKQTERFYMPQSLISKEPAVTKLLNAPKTGRVVKTILPKTDITKSVLSKSKSAKVHISGSDNSLRPLSKFTASLDRTTQIASGITDVEGNIESNINVPESTSSGLHTIDITVINLADSEILLTQPVVVEVSNEDSDGDGVLNTTDTCPLTVDSSIDADLDGIDDSCDGYIAPSPTDSPTISSPSSVNTSSGSVPLNPSNPTSANSPPPASPQSPLMKTLSSVKPTISKPTSKTSTSDYQPENLTLLRRPEFKLWLNTTWRNFWIIICALLLVLSFRKLHQLQKSYFKRSLNLSWNKG